MAGHSLYQGPRELADGVPGLDKVPLSEDKRAQGLGPGVITDPQNCPRPLPLLREKTLARRRSSGGSQDFLKCAAPDYFIRGAAAFPLDCQMENDNSRPNSNHPVHMPCLKP